MRGGRVGVVIGYFHRRVLLDSYIIDLLSAFPLSAFALIKSWIFWWKSAKVIRQRVSGWRRLRRYKKCNQCMYQFSKKKQAIESRVCWSRMAIRSKIFRELWDSRIRRRCTNGCLEDPCQASTILLFWADYCIPV